MFWSRIFGAPVAATASDAARTLAARAARQREIDAITITERRDRIVAELRRSGARSTLPPRDEVVAPIRAARSHRKEQEIG
jgi:hypothetical protein